MYIFFLSSYKCFSISSKVFWNYMNEIKKVKVKHNIKVNKFEDIAEQYQRVLTINYLKKIIFKVRKAKNEF